VSSEALSDVVRLEVTRPPGFEFEVGDYVFLRIPKISQHEWHPFSVSSSPEHGTLTFYIRSLGNWTAALRRFLETQPNAAGLAAYVDGPYGSSAPIAQSRFAVLIGAGIGVTPFASVLESVVLKGKGASHRPSRLEKVEFFWLNHDPTSFEWFRALLAELETLDLHGLVDFHLFMTGARAGDGAAALEVERAAAEEPRWSSITTILRTHTHLGTPDWMTLLGQIARQHHPEPVDVFFSGPPRLAAGIRRFCQKLGMSFHEERF
jgi:NADPH oxidase 5